MRIIPFLTAIVVMAVLYVMVLERDRVMSFVRGGDTPPAADTGETTTAPPAKAQAPEENTSGVSVVAFHSTARSVANAVLVRGRTEAARQVNVMAETSGAVISEPLRKGAFVDAGEALCKLDPGTREISLAEAQARLAEARAHLPEAKARVVEANAGIAEAEINDNAAARLLEGGYASETRAAATNAAVSSARAGLEAAKSGLEAAASGVKSAEAGVAAAEKEIDRLTIVAPFSGLLETDSAELGALLMPGALCATIIQLDPIKLVGFVPETDVDKVTVGSLAGARLATGRDVQGRVSFLSRSADETTRTFRVEISIPNPGLAIRDGQTAEIVISSGDQRAHLLPQSALTLDDAGQIGVRVVGDNNIVAFSPVTVLRDTTEGIWVGGLPEKTDVIVVGQEFVTAGVAVNPTYNAEASQ